MLHGMDALAPLIGVLIMSIALIGNFFFTAWKLGILRAFGRRRTLSWRVLTAGALSACLPFAGAMITLAAMPADDGVKVAMNAAQLAFELGLTGFVLHLVNDQVVNWAGAMRQA